MTHERGENREERWRQTADGGARSGLGLRWSVTASIRAFVYSAHTTDTDTVAYSKAYPVGIPIHTYQDSAVHTTGRRTVPVRRTAIYDEG